MNLWMLCGDAASWIMEFHLYLEAGAGDSHSLSSRCFQSWPQTPFPSLDCKNTKKTVRLLGEVCEVSLDTFLVKTKQKIRFFF